MGKPKIKTSQISAYAELQALFNKKNLKYIDDGCVFSSEETAQLSSCIKSLSPNYSRKLYAPIHDNEIGYMIGGKIQINSKGANALLYPRLDGPVIDFDLAVFLMIVVNCLQCIILRLMEGLHLVLNRKGK